MKQFFKFFTASCLGTLAALGVIALFITGMVMSSASGAKNISNGTILELDFNKVIPEKSNNVVQSDFDLDPEDYPGLRKVKRALKNAATDDRIAGIVLSTKSSALGPSTVYEIHDALKDFKESGKFVYSYADYYSQNAYLLATTADSIFLNPNGLVELKGYGALLPFFKPFMDKWGLKFDIYYAGKFKSATEPFRRTNMSEPNKKQTKEYLQDLIDIFSDQICENRNLDRASFDEILEFFGGRNATLSKEKGLVDVVSYHNDFHAFLKEKTGVKAKRKLKTQDLEEYISKISLTSGTAKNKIAVVYAEGNIVYDNGAPGQVDDTRYLKALDKIKRDKDIKAVVLRINSPGGSALTSDIIWNEIEELKADSIPVIASMGDYAASGGYYIACNADQIFASESTLTGSIGVFSMMPNMKKFLNEKVGIVFDTVKTHDLSLMNNFVYDPNAAENLYMQQATDDLYLQFLNRVADGRKMSVQEVDQIAQGRVWTGRKAKEIGLVDQIGNLDDAIKYASELADIEKYKIKEYPYVKENPFKDIMKALNATEAKAQSNSSLNKVKKYTKLMQDLDLMLQMEGPITRMPFSIQSN